MPRQAATLDEKILAYQLHKGDGLTTRQTGEKLGRAPGRITDWCKQIGELIAAGELEDPIKGVQKAPVKPSKAPEKPAKTKSKPASKPKPEAAEKAPEAPKEEPPTEGVCQRCGGQGFIWQDSFNMEKCICSLEASLEQKLHDSIRGITTHISADKLAKSGVSLDADLYLKVPWHKARVWLASAIRERHRSRSFVHNVVSDSEILSAWLSPARRETFEGDERDGLFTQRVATLEDLIRPPELLVIRLGILGYKNQAMSGILLESLMLRKEIERKPTWVVVDPDEPLVDGHRCWSSVLEKYLDNHFITKTIKRTK